MYAQTASCKGDRLQPDDVVLWVPMVYERKAVMEGVDPRIGWVGLIVAKVRPAINVANLKGDILCYYT